MTTMMTSELKIWILIVLGVFAIGRSSLLTDKEILSTFRSGIVDQTGILNSWNSRNVCTWTGVICINDSVRILNLTTSQLAGYYISGTISPAIGGLENLTSLDLSGNRLTGSIPHSLANCSKLKVLRLSLNSLTGAVPDTLGNLPLLQSLELQNNALNSTIPAALGKCASLRLLDLSTNMLSGVIPEALGNCSKLEMLRLFSNSLTGKLPGSLGNLPSLLNLQVQNNELNFQIPDAWQNCRSLSVLDLSGNKLNGSLPLALGNCTSLTVMDLSANQLSGVIPQALASCVKLFTVNMTGNLLSGPIPPFIGKIQNLTRLHLSNNLLTGSLPNGLFSLSRLSEVVASGNRLSGFLPDTFSEINQMTRLDLSGNLFSELIPNSIGNCTSLLDLDLSHNQFRGPIPDSIGNRPRTFEIRLDLSHNGLSGQIPAKLGDLQSASLIDLSANDLSGVIPSKIAGPVRCLTLGTLNLSNNSLVGEIPDSLRYCRSLKVLDLSENLLVGIIPSSLANLQLSFLNLSYNNLAGSIDAFNFTEESFKPGNDGLCGLILGKKCPKLAAIGAAIVSWKRAGWACLGVCVFIVAVSIIDERFVRYQQDPVAYYSCGDKLIRLNVEDLLKATDNFNPNNVIGRGGTSTVYKGVLEFHPFTIAVKKFKDSADGRRRLLKEAGMMRMIRHRNLVSPLGISSVPRSMNVLVLEYMANGTLTEHLHLASGRDCKLSWDMRLGIAIDVASGVSYLHEDTTPHSPLIHGDLKPANIFLNSDFLAKVGDFGLARPVQEDITHNGRRREPKWEGTFGYTPPEYGEGFVSPAGDVYSFGVVILEMLTGRRPNHSNYEEVGMGLVDWARQAYPANVAAVLDPRLREDFVSDKESIKLFCKVGLLCTRDNPRERPSMKEALEMLKTISGATTEPAVAIAVPTIEQLIDEPSFTSFLHAKSWQYVKDLIMANHVTADHSSWFSLFRVDLRNTRVLKAMEIPTTAIVDNRKARLLAHPESRITALSRTFVAKLGRLGRRSSVRIGPSKY